MRVEIRQDGTAYVYEKYEQILPLAYTKFTLFDIDITEKNVQIKSLCKEIVFVDSSIKGHNRNTLIFFLINYYCKNMYNKYLWRSSDKNTDTLYRPLLNVKGVDLKLFPFAKIKS